MRLNKNETIEKKQIINCHVIAYHALYDIILSIRLHTGIHTTS
jgi:hypothetical protein